MSTGAPRREVAHRLFAAEFADATVSVADADEEMAPTYVLTPTGAMANRAFVVGVLTEVDQVGADIYRGRVNDPTGTFVAYAGQYQPTAANFLSDASPPAFVALTGKARTFQPEDSDRIYSSLRPERIVETTTGTRDRWVAEAARHTLGRIALMASVRAEDVPADRIAATLSERGVGDGLARGIARSVQDYDTSADYLRALWDRAVGALEVLADERDAVDPLELDPGGGGEAASYESLAATDFAAVFGAEREAPVDSPAPDAGVSSEPPEDAAETPAASDGADPGDGSAADGEATPAEEPPDDDVAAVTPDEPDFELSESERAAVEAEYDTDFATGDAVESPAEPPDDPTPSGEAEAPAADEEAAGDVAADDDAAADDDLEATVVAHMRELDDGDGVDRQALIDRVDEAVGAGRDAIDDAIQEALMSGSCYEPAEGRLKPI